MIVQPRDAGESLAQVPRLSAGKSASGALGFWEAPWPAVGDVFGWVSDQMERVQGPKNQGCNGGDCTSQDGGTRPPCPVFLDLAGRPVAVVGGGPVALRKVETLVRSGARVTVVAPAAKGELRALAAAGRVTWCQRDWLPRDCDGAVLVIAATSDARVNRAIAARCHARGQLVNVVDDRAGSTAIIPATVRRGPFQIAVSTDGASPLLARAVREELEARYPAYYEDYVLLLGEVRKLVRDRVAGDAQGRRKLYAALETDGDLLEGARAGRLPTAEEAYARIVEPLLRGEDQ